MSYFEHYAKGKRLAKQAVKDDENRDYKAALEKYVLAAGELMKSIQCDHEEKRRNACKKAAARYVKRAEVLKVHLERKDSLNSEEKRKEGDEEDKTTQSKKDKTSQKEESNMQTKKADDGLVIPEHIMKSNEDEHSKREKLRSILEKMKPAITKDSPLPAECTKTPLPKNWREYEDPKSGSPYAVFSPYVNRITHLKRCHRARIQTQVLSQHFDGCDDMDTSRGRAACNIKDSI